METVPLRKGVFLNTELPPLSTKHISWCVSSDDDNLILSELVERKYPHPDAPEVLSVIRLETDFIKKVNRLSLEAAPLIVLKASLDTISLIRWQKNQENT